MNTEAQESTAVVTYKIIASTGYESEAEFTDVTPNQYRQMIAALSGTLKEATIEHDDALRAEGYQAALNDLNVVPADHPMFKDIPERLL